MALGGLGLIASLLWIRNAVSQKIEAVESWGIVPVRRSLWRMAEVFGGEPRFDYFETPVVIDNAFK